MKHFESGGLCLQHYIAIFEPRVTSANEAGLCWAWNDKFLSYHVGEDDRKQGYAPMRKGDSCFAL